MNKEALDLIKAIDDYIEASSKTDYELSLEEQQKIDRYIKILDNQLSMLIDYELKKEGVKNDR